MPNPDPDPLPWGELEARALASGGTASTPGLTARILAETARLRAEAAAARESARVMVLAAFALSVLLLGYTEFDARNTSSAAQARLEEWDGLAQWVASLE